jgi:diacylglycerol kinase (ATP)
MVIIVGFWLTLSPQDWAILILTIGTVWASEFINTALEAVVDLASPQKHPLAKVGKDVGAAAVLISALSAIMIGLIIIGPPLWRRLSVLFFLH